MKLHVALQWITYTINLLGWLWLGREPHTLAICYLILLISYTLTHKILEENEK